MFNVPISFRSVDWTSAATIRSQVPAKKDAAPETDVINLSWMKNTQYEGASDLEMRSPSTHYIPPRLNEDGSWSLAEYVPFSPDAPLPDGAVPIPSTCGCGRDHQELLDRLSQLTGQVRSGFDARA